MNVQNPFDLVRSPVCTGSYRSWQPRLTCHITQRGRKVRRGLPSCGQPRGSTAGALPALCLCWRWLCASSAAVLCSAVDVPSKPIPRPNVATADRPSLTSRSRAPPTARPGQYTVPTTLSATEVTGFCVGLSVQPHPQLTVL